MGVIRIEHNRENPYVLLNKQPLFDDNLSFKAKGLWAQCLARKDDWKFHINEMVKKCKEGKGALYSAIDELIKNNYALRIDHYEKSEDGKFTSKIVEYIFFEFQVSDQEKEKYIEEFKKCFRRCGFGDLRNGDLRNPPLVNKEEESKERGGSKEAPPVAPPLFFSKGREMANLFWQYLHKIHPSHKKPSLDEWANILLKGYMNDSYTWDDLGIALSFIFEKNPFWALRINYPGDLLRYWDELWKEIQIKSKHSNSEKNRKFAWKVKEFMESVRKEGHTFEISPHHVIFPNGQDVSLKYTPHEKFRTILMDRYNIT